MLERTTAELHQPQPFEATAAGCHRPLGRRTDPNGHNLTVLSEIWFGKKTPPPPSDLVLFWLGRITYRGQLDREQNAPDVGGCPRAQQRVLLQNV